MSARIWRFFPCSISSRCEVISLNDLRASGFVEALNAIGRLEIGLEVRKAGMERDILSISTVQQKDVSSSVTPGLYFNKRPSVQAAFRTTGLCNTLRRLSSSVCGSIALTCPSCGVSCTSSSRGSMRVMKA